MAREGADLPSVQLERAAARSRVLRAGARWSLAHPLAQPLEVSTTGCDTSSSESQGLARARDTRDTRPPLTHSPAVTRVAAGAGPGGVVVAEAVLGHPVGGGGAGGGPRVHLLNLGAPNLLRLSDRV